VELLNWKEILKVDNLVFEPDNRNTAWYDPRKDEITLNLSSVGSEGEDDEFVIMNLEQISVHENAHRAVKYVLGDAFQKLLDKLGESVANALNGENEDSGSKLHDLLDAIIKMLSMDEAYAYSTGGTVQRKPQVNLIESVHGALLEPLSLLHQEIIEDVQQQAGRNKLALLMHIPKINKLFGIMEAHILREAAIAEASVIDFISDMGDFTEEEKNEYVERYMRKIQNMLG
tara:strand:- start:3334 stop:4023 length:690 start_codon:yes stop_codon:yes gene_type:complete